MARPFFNTHQAEPRADFSFSYIKPFTIVDDKQTQAASILRRKHDAGCCCFRVTCDVPERFLNDSIESQRDQARNVVGQIARRKAGGNTMLVGELATVALQASSQVGLLKDAWMKRMGKAPHMLGKLDDLRLKASQTRQVGPKLRALPGGP